MNATQNGTESATEGPAVIAFSNAQNQLSLMNIDGSVIQSLTSGGDVIGRPAWSPNGKSIAYVVFTGKFVGYICKVDIAQGNIVCLTGPKAVKPTQSGDDNPAWSPDGKTIAFDSFHDQKSRVYLMDSDGSNIHPLTDGPSDTVPAWSSDGKQITFATTTEKGAAAIAVVNTDGTDKQIIADVSFLKIVRGLSWSPDGQTLAITASDFDGSHIYMLDVKTGKLPPTPFADGGLPSWSPNGQQIVFEGQDRTGQFVVYLANADGSHIRQVGIGAFPAWKPISPQPQ